MIMLNNVGELVNYLKECDHYYYDSTNPIVSNDTYDALVQSLRKLDPANKYLSKVGAEVSLDSNKSIGRLLPMGTLSKYYAEETVKDWVKSETGTRLLLSPKYDGFGVELTYVDGELKLASTRGNGFVGEDVTEAIMSISSAPKTVYNKSLTSVRGEVIIPRIYHEKMKELGYTAMRNAVPGIVKSNRVEALPYVKFVTYEFFDESNNRITQREDYGLLFETEDYQVVNEGDFDTLLNLREYFSSRKDSYLYEIDGIVIKTEIIKEDNLSTPKHQIAWKFESNRKETILRSIEFQLGVTGKITPIGIFDPVEFQGAILTRASLGSMGRYYDLKPCIGDTVEVSRRGDIIPYIEDIKDKGEGEFYKLDLCPHCESTLRNDACINKFCKEKIKLQIMYYVGSMGVKGIGPSLVNNLVDKGFINSLSDIYKVQKENILGIPRQGESSASKWQTLQNKELRLIEFLISFPFDNIGSKTWESITNKWTFKEIINLTADDLFTVNIKGLGEGKIKTFIEQLEIYKFDMEEMYNLAKIK